jgi:MGT family glycosyltransferase
MSHVAIFVFPGYGHVNPTIELTRHLVELGHRVSYVVDELHAAQVSAAGARAVGYRSRRRRFGAAAATGEDIGALGLDFLCDSMDVILPRTLQAFVGDRPDLILYDLESFFTARTVARRWGCPTVQLFPYVATNEHFSLALEVFAGASVHVQQCIDVVTAYLTGHGDPPEAVWQFMANFDARNIVLLPREFQPRGETFDERYTFVGHSFPTDPPPRRPRPGDGRPVVLVSLGTEVNDRPGFFDTCDAAFADARWHVVMALGRGNLPTGRPPAPDHVEMHEWIPYREVLPHTDVVVCHGGMGSILEALYFGRPLVIVPHTPEQELNARRTAELGLGVMLPEHDFTAERLRAAVELAAGDHGIRDRLAAMRSSMRAAGGPAAAARLVDDYLASLAPATWAGAA